MKKFLSLTLAIIVLACAVVVFVPTGTASASETDGIGVWVLNESLSDSFKDANFSSNVQFYSNYQGGPTYFDMFCIGFALDNRNFMYITDTGSAVTVYDFDHPGNWIPPSARHINVVRFLDMFSFNFLLQNATYLGPAESTAFNVTYSVTNGSVYGDSTLTVSQSARYVIIPNTGYGLPANITVTGATLNSYDPNTGKFTLSNASADVSVSASCPALPVVTSYPVVSSVTYGRLFGDAAIDNTQTKTYTIAPNNGYGLPDTVSVTGATLKSYDKSTGVLAITNPTGPVTISAECPVLAVDPNSASYQAGYNNGVHDAYSTLLDTVLSTNDNISTVSVVAYDSAGVAVPGTHWDQDFNYTYNNEQYLRIYNITVGSTVDHFVITLSFKNGQAFVPTSVRSPVGFTSSGNETAPLKPVSYLGNGMYGSDFTELGASTSFIVQMPGNQKEIALRLIGSGYGQNLNDVYDKGVQDGFAKGEKVGYDKGKADGIRDSKEYTFFNLIAAVIDVPVNAFLNLFNLDVFGVNLAPLMTAVLSICLVIAIVKMLI